MYVEAPESGLSTGVERDTPGWPFAVAGGILGWVLDAFDFFVVVFLLNELMARFNVGKPAIVWSLTATLAMRPVGALVFGAVADRWGRKRPLITCVLYFSTITVLSGFAPNYAAFLVLRALYGIGMGGYWGIGASYAMESAPRRHRGLLSGLMQGGYPFGYLLASIGMQTVAVRWGWQAMFVAGLPVALGIVLVTVWAPESDAWRLNRSPSVRAIGTTLLAHVRPFGYLLLVMTAMTSLSHGTQDLYPDFLKTLPFVARGTVFGMRAGFGIPVLYNIAAIVGALVVGQMSERVGRRRAVLLALVVCLLSMWGWAFGETLLAITIGACAMQAGVQGAFGVIPAHLNELSPAAIRGVFTGFVYQLGVLVASPVLPVQNLLQRRFGYSWALTAYEMCVIGTLMVLFAMGPERRGRSLRAGAL